MYTISHQLAVRPPTGLLFLMNSSSNGHIDGVTVTLNYVVRGVIVTPFMSLCLIYKIKVYPPEHTHTEDMPLSS